MRRSLVNVCTASNQVQRTFDLSVCPEAVERFHEISPGKSPVEHCDGKTLATKPPIM